MSLHQRAFQIVQLISSELLLFPVMLPVLLLAPVALPVLPLFCCSKGTVTQMSKHLRGLLTWITFELSMVRQLQGFYISGLVQ